ncbi:MAG: hypothetical protein AAGD43_23955 [Pseudomonadota bacterium]
MTTLRLPASTKMLVKLMLAASITMAAAAFLTTSQQSSASALQQAAPTSYGSVVVTISPFQPERIDPIDYNDARS